MLTSLESAGDGRFRRMAYTIRMRSALAAPPTAGTALSGLFSQVVAVDEARAVGPCSPDGPLRHLVIALCSAGRVETVVHERHFTYLPGTLSVITPGSDLRNDVQPGPPWQARYLMLAGPWADRVAARLDGGVLVAPKPPPRLAAQVGEAIAGVLIQRPAWDWHLAAALAELAAWIEVDAASAEDLLLRLGALIDAAPDERWPLPTVARRLGLGVDALDHRLRALCGQAPARWIRSRRIAHAQRLLAAGASTASAAAALHLEPTAFSRMFLAVTGQRPGAWSRSLRAW